MSVRRAGPGVRLSTGRLRVDAARAIAKLREYQLADRHGWVLEAVRAAVASGATRIDLRGDSNDVWLGWHGEPWPADDLPRLLDELVSPEARRGQHLRLLAAAVNTALGCDPAWVDVIAVTAGGDAARVRYTPDTLAVGDLDGDGIDDPDALRALAATPIIPPPGAPSPGMFVHLRRRAGLETLRYLARGANPPELAIARDACADITVPMTVDGAAIGRALHRRDLVRIPLGHDLDGFVAVLDPAAPRTSAARASFDVAEHGVRLTTYAWTPAGGPGATDGTPVPLRLFVDGPRMPTNASRSEVRRDAHPINAAELRGAALLDDAIDAIGRTLADEAAAPADRERARAAAFALLASAVDADDFAGSLVALTGALRRLAERPLVRNAIGQARPLLGPWRLSVHTGKDPFPEELAPWLGDVAWVAPGDPSTPLFARLGLDGRAVREHAKRAREELKARRRFYDHAPQPGRVSARAAVRVRATLGAAVPGSCVPDATFAGLSGEVGLTYDEHPGELEVLLDGRPLATVPLPELPGVLASISSPDVVPTDRYRGVVDDPALARVRSAAAAGAVRAAEALALGRPLDGVELGPARSRDDDARLVRDALGRAPAIAWPDAWTSPLVRAPVWPTHGGAWVSLDSLTGERAVGAVVPGESIAAPRGRVVVLADPLEQGRLTALLGAVPLVPYPSGALRPVLDRAMDLATRLAGHSGVALAIREDTWTGAIAPGAAKRVIHHAGIMLAAFPLHPTHLPCQVVLDGDDVIPTVDWKGVRGTAGLAACDVAGHELALVRSLVRRLLGQVVPELVVMPEPTEVFRVTPDPLDERTGRALGAALSSATTRPTELLGAELHAALCARPLVRMLGVDGLGSLDALAAAFPAATIPFVRPGTAPTGDDWRPLVADDALAALVGRVLGRRVRDATDEADKRRHAARREARLAAMRAQPRRELAVPDAAHEVALQSGLADGRVAAGDGGVAIDVLIEGHPFVRLTDPKGLPLEAVVDVPLEHADADALALLPESARRLIEDVGRAAPALLEQIAQVAPRELVEDERVRVLLGRYLDGVTGSFAGRDTLLAAPAFAAVQGGHASIRAATRGLAVSIASWHGEWLAAEGGGPDDLDRPVLYVPDGHGGDELRALIGGLARSAVVDVTGAVHKLQAQRRMARGLLPTPTVQGALPLLTRTFAELGGDDGLGPGEIALVDRPGSSVWLHQAGQPVEELELDVEPSVVLAIEAGDLIAAYRSPAGVSKVQLAPLTRRAQQLASKLVAAVLATTRPDGVAPWLRTRLRRALFEHRLAPVELGQVPVFETTAGTWLTWAQVEALDGDVWYTGFDSTERPLDESRVVLRLAPVEVPKDGMFLGVRLVDATEELALDARTRVNRTRPRFETLELTAQEAHDALAVRRAEPRPGGGTTGVVAVLDPAAARRRGLRMHRSGYPFDLCHDVCDWPTLAIVDNPELAPDRTWSRPANDLAYARLVAEVRQASEEALAGFASVPSDALASLPVLPALYSILPAFTEEPHVIVRGALWLADAPPSGGTLRLHTIRGPMGFTVGNRVPLQGELALFTPELAPIELLLEELGRAAYPILLRSVRRHASQFPAAAAAHLAFGINSGHVTQDELHLEPGLARLVEEQLSGHPPRARPRRATTAPPPIPAAARAPHPLDGLARALQERFRRLAVIHLPRVEVAAGVDPIVSSVDGGLRLAGDNRLLHAIAAALAARHVSASDAVDALVAHATTVLNADLTGVTDATELRLVSALL